MHRPLCLRLGNPAANTLPTCQLRYLQAKVNALHTRGEGAESDSEPVLFWIDSLCIPVSEQTRDARHKAIAQMKNTYEEADAVLVLNKELEHVSAHTDPATLNMNISRAPWFRRLWTLQEGLLARDIFFQLENKAISLKELLADSFSHPYATGGIIHAQILRDSQAILRRFASFRGNPAHARINDLWRAVQWRTISHDQDETVSSDYIGSSRGPGSDKPS